ncbi:unnamed protein product [Peniophora sp. CBMAI 1063]|nr:unnamed protein product [Peniophora sp. CBMAI 1063]
MDGVLVASSSHKGEPQQSLEEKKSQNRKKKILRDIQEDPNKTVQVIRKFWQASVDCGVSNTEPLLAMLELFTDPILCYKDILGDLLRAGLLSFLTECITSPTLLVMHQTDAHLLVSMTLRLFSSFIAACYKTENSRLLSDILEEVCDEPWASIWASRSKILRSEYKPDILEFICDSGFLVGSISELCDKPLDPTNRIADLMFYAWYHVEDSSAKIIQIYKGLCGILYRDPNIGFKWREVLAPDGLAVSSLVSEYGPQELVRRAKSALDFNAKPSGRDHTSDSLAMYRILLLLLVIPGICCHSKCRRFLLEHDILSATHELVTAYWEEKQSWPAMISILLAMEEYHRTAEGTPGTYEFIEPKMFGLVLMDGMFRLFADCVDYSPDEAECKQLVELFRRHPASSAPLRMQYGFWARTQPTFWYAVLIGLRSAAYREYGKPAHEDILFLEKSWIEWGEKARIDEKGAERQHESERSRLCCSMSCPRRRGTTRFVISDHALMICRGCGEARYCDKVCQKRAWKEGHRESCRRLPAP